MTPATQLCLRNAGVQTYVTAPLRFREGLSGKNFVQVCLIVIELALCIAGFATRVGTRRRRSFSPRWRYSFYRG